jgi:hypothetical protein
MFIISRDINVLLKLSEERCYYRVETFEELIN